MSRFASLWRGKGASSVAPAINAAQVAAAHPPTALPHVSASAAALEPDSAVALDNLIAASSDAPSPLSAADIKPILKPATTSYSTTTPSSPSTTSASVRPRKNGKVGPRKGVEVDELGRKKNYPTHVPLNSAQNALLAVGSGLWGVMNYATRPDLIATLSETTSSSFLSSLHSSMSLTPEGRQILRDQPTLSSKTVNLDYLRGLRRGTLGREYVEWLDRDGITPDSREVVRYIDSPSLAYTMLRYRQTHDLYHTLFCLPPTLVHELSLKVVEWANMKLPAAALSSTFGPLRLSAKRRRMWVEDWVPWALRQGEQGRTLNAVYWEKRWEQGIGELRRELGVARMNDYAVESRWKGYRVLREMERELRRKGEWIDEPEEW